MAPAALNSTTRRPGTRDARLPGTLIRVHPKGYGFIRLESDGQNAEYYVHIHDFPERTAWIVGQPVFFEVGLGHPGSKAPKATNITLRKKV